MSNNAAVLRGKSGMKPEILLKKLVKRLFKKFHRL